MGTVLIKLDILLIRIYALNLLILLNKQRNIENFYMSASSLQIIKKQMPIMAQPTGTTTMRLALRTKGNWKTLSDSSNHRSPMLRARAAKISRRLLQHILPLLFMLLVMSWLALKAGQSIQQAKQPPGFTTLSAP